MVEPLSKFIKFAVKIFGFYKQEGTARLTMFPVSHLDKQEKQAQLYS